jgi:hypothetical protein
MMRLLLQGGAPVDARVFGRTALHDACEAAPDIVYLAEAYEDVHYEAASLLLAHGADVNSKAHNSGCTPLHKAAFSGRLRLVRLLLGANADVNAVSGSGCTPLHKAYGGDQRVAVELLERGADPGARDKYGNTVLYLACRRGNAALVKRILQYSGVQAHINTAGESGHTPLTVACYDGGQPELLRVLLAAGADITSLVRGMTPLHLALESMASSDRYGCLEVLLAAGADPSAPYGARAVDWDGVSLEGANVLQRVVQQCPGAAVLLLVTPTHLRRMCQGQALGGVNSQQQQGVGLLEPAEVVTHCSRCWQPAEQ